MIIKRLKKLWKISGLIAIRQGYFLARNWYLIFREPYLTLKAIKDKGDKSQFFLVSATALAPIWIYILARIAYDLVVFQKMIWITGRAFLVIGIIQLIILGYLAYWSLRVIREK